MKKKCYTHTHTKKKEKYHTIKKGSTRTGSELKFTRVEKPHGKITRTHMYVCMQWFFLRLSVFFFVVHHIVKTMSIICEFCLSKALHSILVKMTGTTRVIMIHNHKLWISNIELPLKSKCIWKNFAHLQNQINSITEIKQKMWLNLMRNSSLIRSFCWIYYSFKNLQSEN